MILTPALIVHVAAGSLGILSGAAAVSVRKGERLHRAFGKVFLISMLVMAVMAIYLALFVPASGPAAAPPRASIAIAVLTFYLVATAWMTVRRGEGRIGLFEKLACLVASCTAAVLIAFGVHAALHPSATFNPPAPYFVFAAFATFGAAMDLRMILRGGISGASRIARHLWRMCFALFFAASFFFLGQQKVMPAFMHGSPILIVLALAPLAVMIFWLVRVRYTRWYRATGPTIGPGL